MTPQELKNSILQLAIQGKLVEQRAEEGTGSELLEKILAAKNAEGAKGREIKFTRSRGVRGGSEDEGISNLSKAAKSHPGKLSALSASPREEIPDDEKPFDIPESWEWVRLGDLVIKDIKRGKSPTYTQKSGTLVFAQKCNTKAGVINLSLALFLDEAKLSKYPESEFMRDCDIVINSTGNGTLGRVGIYRDSDNPNKLPVVPDSHVTVIRVGEKVSVEYVFYGLKHYQPLLEKLCSGSTNQTELSASTVKSLLFPLPPLAEQKRIVAKIEELLPLVERYEKAWSRLEDFNTRFPADMQKSLLQMAIQGKLVEQRAEEGTGSELLEKILAAKNAEKNLTRSRGVRGENASSALSASPRDKIPDDEKPFDIPESWEWVRLGEVMLDVSTGPFGSMLHKADYCDGGIPLVNPMNIQNGRIVPSDKMRVSTNTAERLSAYRLSKGMIVVARRGELGRCASVGDEQDGWLCGTGSFFLDPSKDIFVQFITLIISSPYARQLFAGKAVGTTMANLNHNLLKALPIPLPPLSEQKRIVAKLEELLPLCERLK